MTQVKLAELSGVPSTSISHFENGARNPSFDNLILLSKALSVPSDYLLGISEEDPFQEKKDEIFKSKEIDLRPYLGKIVLCKTLEDLMACYQKLTGSSYPFTDDAPDGGRYIQLNGENNDVRWLVWGNDFKCVVHELCHVLLHTFGKIGHDPTNGDGEPFCYMLSALMDEVED